MIYNNKEIDKIKQDILEASQLCDDALNKLEIFYQKIIWDLSRKKDYTKVNYLTQVMQEFTEKKKLMMDFCNIYINYLIERVDKIVTESKSPADIMRDLANELEILIKNNNKINRIRLRKYAPAILYSLYKKGGILDLKDLINEIEPLAERLFEKNDFNSVKFGSKRMPKWQREVRALKGDLGDLELLDKASTKGMWKLTEKGKKFIERVIKSG